jgi:uncharacterized protein YegP (UPF0339 family)
MHFQIYRDAANLYRWRLRAANNETIADGAEGYASKRYVMRAVSKLVAQMLNLEEIPVIERLK